jgi:hypothetical protein
VARGFVLGSYLLVKGSHTFVNMDVGTVPQWFPEYGVDLGLPASPPRASIEALRVRGGLYVRPYARGLVAVNPDVRPLRLRVPAGMRLVRPVGGGELPANASTAGWRLVLLRVAGPSVIVPAHGGVVLVRG